MFIINVLKVGLIWLADGINRLWYPFKNIVYAPVSNVYLLEPMLYKHLSTSFVDHGTFKYQLPMPDDAGDHALFQGLYTAMVNLKYATPNPETQEANAALGKFFIDGVLIRGYNSDGTPNDTTSNDSATGMLYGLYIIWRRSTREADAAILRWAFRIVDADYSLTDLQLKPTKYGKLEDGIKTDPLRLTLLMAVLALAAKCDGANSLEFHSHYDKLYEKYRLLLRYPKVKLLWWDTDYDTHRAAIHLHILYNLTKDNLYADGLRRIHRITNVENNAWVQVLCYPAVPRVKIDISTLATFHFHNRVAGDVQSINDVPSVKWGGKERSQVALPIWRRGSQEFFWQRNMFSKDEWVGNVEAGVFHCGLDFLIVYWLAVRHGLLDAPQSLPPTGIGVV